MKRKLISIITALAIVFGMIPLSTTAYTSSETFNYDNFKVEYTVINGWGNNRNIIITLTNTGSVIIRNWA